MFLFIAIIIVLYTNNNAICIMHQSTFELNPIEKKVKVYPVKEEKRTNCLY